MLSLTTENKTQSLTSPGKLDLIDAAQKGIFDDLSRLTAILCQVSATIIALIDANGQWSIKSGTNIDLFGNVPIPELLNQTVPEFGKDLIIEDASQHSRFAERTSLLNSLNLRFFASTPIILPDGTAAGIICAVDYRPHILSDEKFDSLKLLAKQAAAQIELSHTKKKNTELIGEVQTDAGRRKTERQLLEAERRLQDFVDYSLGLFCTHDYRGRLLSVNHAAAESLGYTVEELIGRNLLEFLSPETHTQTLEYFNEVKKKYRSKGLMQVLAKNGEKRIWAFRNVRRTDADGQDYVLGCAQDITELKQNEEELVESRQLFQSFMDNSPAVIFLKDENGKYTFINETFERIFQVRFEDVLGKTSSYFVPEEMGASLRNIDALVLKNEQPLKTIEYTPSPDGETRCWLSHKFLIKDKTGRKFVGGIALDITERKQMEDKLKAAYDAALESARLKSAFLTNVSHEIRTPMNGVIGMTELLLDTPLDQVQRDYAETIRQSSDALLTVINDILDLAKIESGKLRFENIDFDIREVVESTVEVFAERAYRKNIEIASLIAPEIPQILCSDPGRLRQVLTNLIGNAIKFTEDGEIGVRVNIEKETDKHLILRFTVTDTGIGISRKDLKNLFQPFIQVDNSTTRQYGGTGLGLAISKQIVEMMNGKIAVESQPKIGSQFSFTARFGRKQKYSEKEIPKINLLQLLKDKRVLIADSSPVTRQTLRQYCDVWEMKVDESATGKDTLRLLKAAQAGDLYDIVIIDMNLPDWEEFSLARKIKSDESLCDTTIILITAYGRRGDGAMAQEAGAAAYLTKPVRGAQFFDCLTTVLKKNQQSSKAKTESFLPLVTRHSLREARISHEPPANFQAGRDFNLLLVEDNEINRFLVIKQLEKINIHPDTSVNGVDALEKIAAKNYQLILMDCQMPHLDGYETARRIRRIEKERAERGEKFAPLVIIALSAHTSAGEREKCLAAGMNDYLSKPVKINGLSAMLEYWYKLKGPVREALSQGKTEELNSNPATRDDSGIDRKPLTFLFNDAINKDFAAEIYALYLTETEERLKQIELAAEKGNGAEVVKIAHAVRGNSLAIGADSIAGLAGQIEELGEQNKFEEVYNWLAKCNREFSHIREQFQKSAQNSELA